MRRKDREITDITQIGEILDRCKTCHLAMVDDGKPYVIPLNYAYEIANGRLTLFFHSANSGRKLDILHKNSSICFEMCCEGEAVFSGKNPCNSGYDFSSVHGFGNVQFIDDSSEKCRALTLLMRHQAGMEVEFTPTQANSVCVYKVVSSDFTGKRKSVKPSSFASCQ